MRLAHPVIKEEPIRSDKPIGFDKRRPLIPPPMRRRSRFNPRLRGGGDYYFSIYFLVLSGFNPRLRGGGDLTRSWRARTRSCFNPRLRRGGDDTSRPTPKSQIVSIHASGGEATTPRAHAETNRNVSIHAFGGEATTGVIGNDRKHRFQSTPPGRRRRIRLAIMKSSEGFNPRLRGGGAFLRWRRGCTRR